MIHYHGTPITPRKVLHELAGKHFCVNYAAPNDVECCHQIGQSVMLDNGAYSFWRQGKPTDWPAYYAWVRPWLDCQSSWAVIPDVIGGSEEENDALITEWYRTFGNFRWNVAPVWHLHESWERLTRLTECFPRVCFGSSGQYTNVNSPSWNNRVNEAFNRLCAGSGRTPCAIHMLRGMSLSGSAYPFASVDSTDVARNHNRPQNNARRMADLWDAQQCPICWTPKSVQIPLEVA